MAEHEAKPTMANIRAAQDSDFGLRRQVAKDHFYSVANRWHFSGDAVASVLALAAPLILVYRPSLGPLLGALAGLWIFLARLLFDPIRQRYQHKGAVAQEAFDCAVLGLPWNDALVPQLSDEEIRHASSSFDRQHVAAKHKAWYPANVEMQWPRSVITCQRSNAVWGRRQHGAYANFLRVAAAAWALIGVVIAIVDQASLAQYLTTIALPSLPALLDATELSNKHVLASTRRKRLEDETDRLFNAGAVSRDELREIQDQIFELRRDAPAVAGWFYRVLARSYETDMRFAAGERADGDE